jgi:hypothetical protein
MTMKRLLPVLICLFISSFLWSQNKDSLREPDKVRFTMGILYSPQYCFRSTPDHPVYIRNADMANYDLTTYRYNGTQSEAPAWGRMVGLTFRIKLFRKIFLTTGLGSQQLSYRTPLLDTVIVYNTGGVSSFYDTCLNSVSFSYTFQYLSVPAIVQYTIHGKKISWRAGAGVELNYFRQANLLVENTIPTPRVLAQEIYSSKGALEFPKLPNDNRFSCWGVVKVGADFKARRIIVSAQPTFRYSFSPLMGRNNYQPQPSLTYSSFFLYSFGIDLSITLKPDWNSTPTRGGRRGNPANTVY